MPGLEDDDWEDEFRPAPHPDDRLWRHPSEIAAEARAAAMAAAETQQVPTLLPPEPATPQPRRRLVAVAALSALLVGGTALAAGTLTRSQTATESLGAATPAATNVAAPRAMVPRSAAPENGVQKIAIASPQGQDQQAIEPNLHAQLSASLPKIQVVTDAGMNEGSGFFLTASGHIATSARLLQSSEYVIVWTEGNRRFPAEVMGVDGFSDVALIKIESSQWPAAQIDEEAVLHLGQATLTLDHEHDALAHGHVASPFGTIRSDGQPSAPRVLISEAAPAGSAIVDKSGAIIAMSNGLTDGQTGKAIATPAWLLERVALDMLVSGNSSHAWLGAEVAETGDGTRVAITEIQTLSPAHQAGLRIGDEIERLDGVEIASLESVMRAIYTQSPGDEIDMMITRDDSRRLVVVTLGSLFD